MTQYEMQLLVKAKEAIFREIEDGVSDGRITEFQLACIHAAAKIDELEKKESKAQNRNGDCIALDVCIDGNENEHGTWLNNVTKVDLPKGSDGIVKSPTMSLTFESIEDAETALEKQDKIRRIEIREAIQTYIADQRKFGANAARHVVMGKFLDFKQSPVTYGGKREVTVRFAVNSYTVYGDGGKVLWMESIP